MNKAKSVSVLFVVGVASAFLLSFVYQKTKPVIEKLEEEKIESSLREVFPDSAVSFEPVIEDTLWRVKRGDKCEGIIFRYGKRGYSSMITPMVGVNNAMEIINVKISREGLSETPGLGMKVTEDWFQKQFSGLSQDEIWLKKDKAEGKVDAVTAATISSRAATSAVREGLKKYKKYLSEEPDTVTEEYEEDEEWWMDDVRSMIKDTQLVVIKEDSLWKSGDTYVYLYKGSAYVSSIGVVVAVRNDTILGIHVQRHEEGLKENESYAGKAASEEYEKRFKKIPVDKVDDVDVITGATVTSDDVKDIIKNGYDKLIKGREE